MSEHLKYEAYKKKLQGICDENNLTFRFRPDVYPCTLTIRPTGGVGGQMNMLENVEENGYTSPEASITIYYKEGVLTYRMSETFTLNDALFSKIKNLYKNMHLLWMQHFFRDVLDKIGKGALHAPDLPSVSGDPDDSYGDPDDDPFGDDMEPLEVEDPDDDFPEDGEEGPEGEDGSDGEGETDGNEA